MLGGCWTLDHQIRLEHLKIYARRTCVKICKLFLPCLLILGLFLPLCLKAEENARELQYQARLEGDMDSELRRALIAQADTFQLQDLPPATPSQLEYRARQDVRQMAKTLQSYGYFRPRIDFELQDNEPDLQVVFSVQLGEQYVLGQVNLQDISPLPDPDLDLPSPEDLGLESGSGFKAQQVRQAEQRIRQNLRNKGRPFVQVELEEVLVDHQEQEVQVQYNVQPGPEASFGQVQLKGLQKVHKSYVLERIPWKYGDTFQASQLEALRRNLVASGLFSKVQVKHAQELDPDGYLQVTLELAERSPRTVKAGLAYETDIGPQLKIGWEHRNVRGKGRLFRSSLSLSPVESTLNAEFAMPRFRQQGQTLKLSSSLSKEDTDAYDSRSLDNAIRLERQLGRYLSAGAGLAFRMFEVSQDEKDEFGLLSIPTSLQWDSRDQVLDPGQGLRAGLRLIPYTDVFSEDVQFFKTHLSLGHYWQLIKDKRFVLATRAAAGFMGGVPRKDIPADERFYAGGGGSVRGYGYQKLGPLQDGDPVGGKSLLEMGAELRLRIGGNSGLVGFLDGGQVYEDSYPGSADEIQWGAGLGYRYYTGFGPLRLDVALPLDKRPDVDSDYQIYISIGQAF